MNKMKYAVVVCMAMVMVLAVMPTQAASKIKKRTVIERINDSMEKSRRVRESKKKARQLKKQEAERKQPHAPMRSQP